MLLGGLVGVGGGRGKAASETRRPEKRRLFCLVCSQVTSHNVEMRVDPRRELKEPGHLGEVSAGRRHWM